MHRLHRFALCLIAASSIGNAELFRSVPWTPAPPEVRRSHIVELADEATPFIGATAVTIPGAGLPAVAPGGPQRAARTALAPGTRVQAAAASRARVLALVYLCCAAPLRLSLLRAHVVHGTPPPILS